MKKRKMFISSLLFASALLFSCATTKEAEQKSESIEISQKQNIEIVEPEPEPEPEPTAEEIFLEKLSGIKLEFTKVPGKIKKNKSFSSAYEVLVTDNEGVPVSDFELTCKIPSRKEGSQLVYSEDKFVTDGNGIISILPKATDFSAKTQIIAAPSIPEGLSVSQEEISAYTVAADFIIESDIATKGAIMFVFEYNENGKSPKNSYDILSGLRKKGVYLIGNAPISDTEYITASKSVIYRENYEYVGTDYGYLIGGTVKFKNPVEKNEDGSYTATMVADIYGIEMKTGNVIYEDKVEKTGSGTNWNKAVEDCREKLTAQVVDSIMFGL